MPSSSSPIHSHSAIGTSKINGNENDVHIPSSSATDTLITQLLEHVHQGRIFDARSIVMKLLAAENEAPQNCSPNLDSVRHVMEEVVAQSQHVESLLSELHSDDNWILAKHKLGVTVHFRREPNSSIHTVRAATTFNNFSPKDFVRFCSLFVETELMHLWFPGHFMQPATLLSWHSKYSKIIQLHINMGIPMMSSRDTVVLGNGYHLPDRNAFLISTKTIIEDSCRYCDIPKPEKGVVRMATESIFFVQLVKSDAISFKMIGRDDLKLKYMPTAVLNYISQGHLPFELLKTIHRTIRNFEGTVWDEKIKERGAYYTEIESKVYDQLERWKKNGTDSIDPYDMYMEDKRRKNTPHVKLEKSYPRGKYYTDSEMLNLICGWGEKCFIGLVMLTILSVLINIMPIQTVELICNENKTCASIVMPLYLLVVLSIILISNVKRESKENVFVDQHQSFKSVNDTMENAHGILNKNQSITIESRGDEDILSSSPQSPPSDTMQIQTACSSATSHQKFGKFRSKLRTGIKGMTKIVPSQGKRKVNKTK